MFVTTKKHLARVAELETEVAGLASKYKAEMDRANRLAGKLLAERKENDALRAELQPFLDRRAKAKLNLKQNRKAA